MGVLGPVVLVFGLAVLDRAHQFAVGDAVGGEAVGDQDPGNPALLLHELGQEPLGGLGVAPALDQDVQDVAVLVDGPPQVLPLAVDLDVDLVQVPFVAGPGSSAPQPAGVLGPELRAPLPDGLVGDDDPAGQEQQLHLAEAQRETVIQPHRLGDDLRREPEPLV